LNQEKKGWLGPGEPIATINKTGRGTHPREKKQKVGANALKTLGQNSSKLQFGGCYSEFQTKRFRFWLPGRLKKGVTSGEKEDAKKNTKGKPEAGKERNLGKNLIPPATGQRKHLFKGGQ